MSIDGHRWASMGINRHRWASMAIDAVRCVPSIDAVRCVPSSIDYKNMKNGPSKIVFARKASSCQGKAIGEKTFLLG